jgi:protein NrfD
MTEIDVARFNPMVDPALHIWGPDVAIYLFLGGMAAGVMILAGFTSRRDPRAGRLFVFLAPLLLSLGMFALFLDLEKKLSVWRFYTAFQWTSPMSWGAWILLLIYPATILFGLAGLRSVKHPVVDLARRHETALRRINIVLGIALGAYTGILLATLNARAAWGSVFLAPLFLASGISAAAALAMLLYRSDEERAWFRRWDMWAIGAELLAIGLFLLDLAVAGRGRGREAAALFFGGPYTAAFWTLVVVAGLAVPFAIELIESRRGSHAFIAPLLVLAGSLALRWILVLAGQVSI